MSTDNPYPKPPKVYQQFVRRYPKLAVAWENINEAGQDGPLDDRTVRLIKLAVSIGAMREGSVHSSVRKAVAMGIEKEALEQVVALAAGAIGMPATVAAYTWVQDELVTKGKD